MAPARGAAGTGATREGCALLQGLAICGICGRRLGVFYRGPAKSSPATSATAACWSAAGRAGSAPGSAACAPTQPSPNTSWRSSPRSRCKPRSRPRNSSRPATMPRSGSGAAGRAGPLRRHPGRAPLPRRRPGEPAGRPRPGSRMGNRTAGLPVSLVLSGPPRISPARPAHLLRAFQDPRHLHRPALAVFFSFFHRSRPLVTPSFPSRLRLHHRRCRHPHRPPRAALVFRADQPFSVDLPKPSSPYRTSEYTLSLFFLLSAHYDYSIISLFLYHHLLLTSTFISFSPFFFSIFLNLHFISPYQIFYSPYPYFERLACTSPPPNSSSPPPPSTSISTTYSSPSIRSPPAPPVSSSSPYPSGTSSPTTPPPALSLLVATASLFFSLQTLLQRVYLFELRASHILSRLRKDLRI